MTVLCHWHGAFAQVHASSSTELNILKVPRHWGPKVNAIKVTGSFFHQKHQNIGLQITSGGSKNWVSWVASWSAISFWSAFASIGFRAPRCTVLSPHCIIISNDHPSSHHCIRNDDPLNWNYIIGCSPPSSDAWQKANPGQLASSACHSPTAVASELSGRPSDALWSSWHCRRRCGSSRSGSHPIVDGHAFAAPCRPKKLCAQHLKQEKRWLVRNLGKRIGCEHPRQKMAQWVAQRLFVPRVQHNGRQ